MELNARFGAWLGAACLEVNSLRGTRPCCERAAEPPSGRWRPWPGACPWRWARLGALGGRERTKAAGPALKEAMIFVWRPELRSFLAAMANQSREDLKTLKRLKSSLRTEVLVLWRMRCTTLNTELEMPGRHVRSWPPWKDQI